MHERTVLVGLDGATFSILDPLMDQGVMPFLKEFVAGGVRAELLSVIPPLTPPAWTSLTTGRSPGNHGIFDFFRFELQNGRYIRVADSGDVGCETIWSMASRHGRRVTTLNFPLMSPPREIDGYVVPGWVPWRYLGLACHPGSLFGDLKKLPGFDARELALDMSPEGNAIEADRKEEDYEEWIRLHVRRERQWFEILRHLMDEDPCPLTAVLFDGVDKLQHFCWRFLDPALLPASPSPWERRIRALCLDYFREIDGFLAEIVARAGSEATVVLASDHGFGATVEVVYVNAWLRQQGYLEWADPADLEGDDDAKLGLRTMARRFYQVDWQRTTAYCPTPSGNGIYVNLAGHEGEKGVAPEEYGAFRQQLIESLQNLRDPLTGEGVVKHVWTREEAFAGPHMALAPDLTLALRDGGFASILPSEAPLKPRREASGTHRPEGIFVAAGPGTRRGVSLAPLSILDVAPVLLYSLDLPIPEDLEGSVPSGVFAPSQIQARPVRKGEPTRSPEPVPAGGPPETEDEDGQAEVIRRLKALGYVE
jgi:predicted AlkP superfamily phosphohydrolase/phosphomutase